jgi:hypothetical protein
MAALSSAAVGWGQRARAPRRGQVAVVRWELLFDDLEARLEANEAAELAGELRDRERAEYARLRITDRLRGSLGREIDATLRHGERERGLLRKVGPDWLLLEPSPERETVVPLAAVLAVAGLGPRSAEPGSEGLVAARLDLGHLLRGLARDRSRLRLVLDAETRLAGVLLRVGADFVEIEEDPGRSRSRLVRLVPRAALGAIRRETGPGSP